ncbi:hypothetical protein MKX03_012692, partial [Papaver bracteatum]
RKACACMDSLLSGRSIYLLKRSLQSFQSLHWVSTLLEMGCEKKTGSTVYFWLQFTEMHGFLQSHFILVPDLDMRNLIVEHAKHTTLHLNAVSLFHLNMYSFSFSEATDFMLFMCLNICTSLKFHLQLKQLLAEPQPQLTKPLPAPKNDQEEEGFLNEEEDEHGDTLYVGHVGRTVSYEFWICCDIYEKYSDTKVGNHVFVSFIIGESCSFHYLQYRVGLHSPFATKKSPERSPH